MQVTGDHFFAGAGFTLNQNTDVFIGYLHDEFTHGLNVTAGTDQAAEQLNFTAFAARTALIVLFTINLTTVQTVEHLVVTGGHRQRRKKALSLVLGELTTGVQNRHAFVPVVNVGNQLRNWSSVAVTNNHSG